MNYELVKSIEIPQYLTKILKTKSRKPTYYRDGKGDVPKMYQDKTKFGFRNVKIGKNMKRVLVSLSNMEPLIANKLSVGTPSYLYINTQKVYSGFDSPYDRVKIVNAVKDFYTKNIKDMTPLIDYPLYIEYEFHAVVQRDYDIDNISWIYIKIFHDWLRSKGYIPNDDIKYIIKYSAELHPVETVEEQKIVVNFYKYPRSWVERITSIFKRLAIVS